MRKKAKENMFLRPNVRNKPPTLYIPSISSTQREKGDLNHNVFLSFFFWFVLTHSLSGQFLHSIDREVNHRPGVFMVL